MKMVDTMTLIRMVTLQRGAVVWHVTKKKDDANIKKVTLSTHACEASVSAGDTFLVGALCIVLVYDLPIRVQGAVPLAQLDLVHALGGGSPCEGGKKRNLRLFCREKGTRR